MKNKNRKQQVVNFVVTLVIAFILSLIFNQNSAKKENLITYDKVITYVRTGQIKKIEAKQDSKLITLTMQNGEEKQALIPSLNKLTSFISSEIKNGTEVEFVISENALSFLQKNLLPILSITMMLSFLLLFKQNMGNSKKYSSAKSNVKFSDIAGIEEEKEQCIEIVNFLKHPKDYSSMGAKIPKGILLNGEPGTGKTLLAKAIAGEAGVPFLQVTGSDFEERLVGVGASRVRSLFQQAKKLAPCIIFIDEIDAVAQNRYDDNNHSHSEQTLNQLLAEMDGFNSEDNVIVIAATNNIKVLDPAILRAGRFDRHIYIPKPDVLAREKILDVYAKNKNFSDDVSFEKIAQKTIGFSGADLENVLNEAAIYAVTHKNPYITSADIDESILKVILGLKKKHISISDEDKHLSSVHEAGHALSSAIFRPDIENLGISIIPRGSAGGYNLFDEYDSNYRKKSDYINQIKVAYGGRIAEEIILGDVSSGASNDLESASKIAYNMVNKFSMTLNNDSLLVRITSESEYNDILEEKNIQKVEEVCKFAYDEVKKELSSHKDILLKLADILLEKESLSKEEVSEFMKANLR